MRALRVGSQWGLRWLVGVPVGVLLMATGAQAATQTTIVNCIGEQTTVTGDGGIKPAQLWPQQLGTMLGATYTVNNDAVNGGTVTSGSAKSATSLEGPPNIVIIGPFAEHDYAATLTLATWQADYKKLVDAYLALTPAPTVYVMTPPPAAFMYQGAAEQTFATSIVKPAVLAVAAGDNAAAKTLKVIDLFSDAALVTAADAAGDGHFTPAGMTEVASLAYKCLAMGMCGAATATGAGGSGGAGGAGGAAGTSGGTAGAGGGTAGAGGSTTGAAGTGGGTTGTAGTGGATTGTAGTAGGTTGTAGTGGGTSTGTAGTAGDTTGAAGTGAGTSTGAGGTSSSERSTGGGGCAVGGDRSMGALASLFVALTLAAASTRRRRLKR